MPPVIRKNISIFINVFAFIAIFFNISNAQSILNEKFTAENFPKFDSYIRTYAPADSAFNVLMTIVNRQKIASRHAAVRQAYLLYGNLFPGKAEVIKEDLRNTGIFMLCTTAQKDLHSFYEQYVRDSANTENGFLALQRIADNYVIEFKFDSAASLYEKFLPLYPKLGEKFWNNIAILTAPIEHLEIRNLGELVNSPAGEWDPNPTPDGRYLYMSTNGREGSYGGHDVFVSTMENGRWQRPINVGHKVNGANNETIDNISADGNTVLLSGNFEGTFGEFDIYMVNRTIDGWGPLEHLPYPVNTKFHDEGANITSDGKAMLFTSDRPEGVGPFVPNGYYYHGTQNGNMDIYVSIKTDSGWSQPINLSTTINTPYAERSPYLHPDGKSLYFSSDGHGGLGRMDVFKSVRLNDSSWTEWSKPENLGKEINTILDDWGYKIVANGDSAFFSRQWGSIGRGDWDIYSVQLPQNAKPRKVVTIRGKVLDKDGNPLEASIKWENLSNGLPAGTLRSNPQDGSYIIILPTGKNYGYYAEKKGYYSTSDNLDLTQEIETKEITRNIKLVNIEALAEQKTKVTLNNIFFDFDSYDLKKESFPELDRLTKTLKENDKIVLYIEGHTDNTGTSNYNMDLSLRRAGAVRDYLSQNGIMVTRIAIKGYGDSMPKASNETEEGKAQNRRVEIWFMKK